MHTHESDALATSVCPLCACVRICHIHRTAVYTHMQDHIMDTHGLVCDSVRACAYVCARGYVRVCVCVCDSYLIDVKCIQILN